ncbi:capsid portal protein [Paraburkholderia sp. GAS33]|jgi:capsid portal protein
MNRRLGAGGNVLLPKIGSNACIPVRGTFTRDDLLAAHRVPPQLIGIVPSNTGGFGAANTAAEVFGANEIAPCRWRFEQINEWIGDEVVRFKPYVIATA